MQFTKSIFALSALASYALAENTLTFVSQDGQDRNIIFTPNAGLGFTNSNISLAGHETKIVDMPENWIGNFFAMDPTGNAKDAGMLGEMSFQSWQGLTFYDVSAIVDPKDTNGIKMIFPKNANTPLAGCQEFPCSSTDIYNKWNDDMASKASLETDYVVLVGTLESQRKRGAIAEEKKKAAIEQ